MMLRNSERCLLLFLTIFVFGNYHVSAILPAIENFDKIATKFMKPPGRLIVGAGEALSSTVLECYGTNQPGCNTDITEAYPELSRSLDNLTEARTRFYLFTPNNPDKPELMHKCGGRLPPNSNFNPKCKTLIVIPGFIEGICRQAIFKELVAQRMKCGCYNYIHVDWPWANTLRIVSAARNIRIVGKQTAEVVRNLKTEFGLTSKDFICMGHSLGAHGCGFVGQEEAIDVIHGLDAAGMLFTEDTPLDERLDPGDAPCVQALHCNHGGLLPFYWGPGFILGTKDIFYNDGVHQPACFKQEFRNLLKGDILTAPLAMLVPGICSHIQCLEYYKESICQPNCNWVAVECKDEKSFLAGECNDCGPNGERCDFVGFDSCEYSKGNGKKLYLKTGLSYPYCDIPSLQNVDKFQQRWTQ